MTDKRRNSLAVRVGSWTSWRNWEIFLALVSLHLRYFRFQPQILATLPEGYHRPVLSLAPSELKWAERWNKRISLCLQRVNAPYARCMKRALVMAMMLGGHKDLWLVIGVLPDNPTEGHAWLESEGKVVVEAFDADDTPYTTIKRLHVLMRNQP